jgi:hypothetical protein
MSVIGSFRTTTGPIKVLSSPSKCIDFASVAAGTQAQIWDCNNSIKQAQFVRPAANSLVLQFSNGLCLAVFNSATANGTPVGLLTCTAGATNQQWFFDRDNRLRPFYAPHKCLDIPGANTANGIKLQLWDCHTGNAQKWTA